MTVLPNPPSDAEVYAYFGGRTRWPFLGLFLAQAALVYGFVRVMLLSPATLIGLVFLTFAVPPMVVNLWLRTRRHRSSLEVHEQLVALGADLQAGRSVDIFVPTCGEDVAVVANTLAHVAALAWSGRKTVYVLDDKASKAVKRLARQHGFSYLAREDRGHLAKAGNLINAFAHSDGEFVVVFDADFAPRPDFLGHVFPYMLDERVGVVQTAQSFETHDRRLNYFARHAGVLQEMFFRWVQPSRDASSAAICSGTNVMYRRAAVASVGGFAEVPIGEDVHSGIKMWGGSYATRYVPLCLARGLAPDTWQALTTQQYGWCRSSLLLMVSPSFRTAPFTRTQRLCFWAAFLFYFSSAAIVIAVPLPVLLMVWMHPSQLSFTSYLPIVPAVVGSIVILPRLVSGWGPRILRVCTVNSFCHLLAVIDALRGRVDAWVPAATTESAGQGDGAVRVRRPGGRTGDVPVKVARLFRAWLVITQAALWAGLAVEVAQGRFDVALVPMVVLGVLQLALLGPLALTLRPVERRRPRPATVTPAARSGVGPTAIPNLSEPEPFIDLRGANPGWSTREAAHATPEAELSLSVGSR